MNIGTTLKTWAKRIKRDGVTLWFAGKHPRTPWYAKALGLFVVAYALSPIDLIPDFIPVLGYVDDVILLPVLIWLTVKGSAHETEKIVRYALSCQPSTMIDMPSSATPAPVQSSADSFTPSTTRSQTSAVAT